MKSLKTLNTGIKNIKNVKNYIFETSSINNLNKITNDYLKSNPGEVVYFVDSFFKNNKILENIEKKYFKNIFYINTLHEPSTEYINKLRDILSRNIVNSISLIVAIGGGCTLDVGKALANLLTNPGKAEDYQGWDLVKKPAIYKIGIPTISGTGAESTRTCVMINKKNGLKLGMNSDFTVFDQLILDPELTITVPRDQYFCTGMDTYIHCIESLNGYYRNAIGDAYSIQALSLCKEVFQDLEMQNIENRKKLMTASYLGGCAISTSYVGLIHPLSAALSVVLGTHHCVANCIVMLSMEEFYPKEYEEFLRMVKKQNVNIPSGICNNLNDHQFNSLYEATIIHEKPLTNALGPNFKNILNKNKVIEIFRKM